MLYSKVVFLMENAHEEAELFVRILDPTWQTHKILISLLVLILIYELSVHEINSQ